MIKDWNSILFIVNGFLYRKQQSRLLCLKRCHCFQHYLVTYCDTLRIQVFLRFSGELVSFQELGQPDLINLHFIVLPVSTIGPINSLDVRFIFGTSRDWNAILFGSL